MPTRRAFLIALSISLLGTLLFAAGPARAIEVYNLDPAADSNGNIAMDGAGNAYIAWTHEDESSIDQPTFCRILAGTGACTSPVTLPIPGLNPTSIDSASAAFPVIGPGETVYVVAPRYVEDDNVVYTSVNRGASFSTGVVVPGGYSNQTEPTDVFRYGSEFLIGAFNASLGVSTTPAAGTGLSLILPPGNLVESSSLGLAGANPVLAYSTLTEPYDVRFFRYTGTPPVTSPSSWVGPTTVTHGYEAELSGGPLGLFMVSADQAGNETPSIVDLRKYTGSGFGPATTLSSEGAPGLFDGGAIAQAPNGSRLAIAWPGHRGGDNKYVMRLFTSTDGGASFTKTEIADLSDGIDFGDNSQMALDDGTGGWLTFVNTSGLHLVDFYPIEGAPPPVAPGGGGSKPADYSGPTKVAATKKAGDYDLTLRLPRNCVQSRQSFFAGVGKRKRKGLAKKLGGKIKFKSVVFFYDGKKLTVKKKKPFRYLIDPGAMAPGSTHVVKTKVTAILTKGGKEHKIKRTLQGTIKAC
jgi:hypothetical protein